MGGSEIRCPALQRWLSPQAHTAALPESGLSTLEAQRASTAQTRRARPQVPAQRLSACTPPPPGPQGPLSQLPQGCISSQRCPAETPRPPAHRFPAPSLLLLLPGQLSLLVQHGLGLGAPGLGGGGGSYGSCLLLLLLLFLALLLLRRPTPLSTRVQPVCLPEPGARPPPGTPCWVTGWGSLRPGGEAEGRARGHWGRARGSLPSSL